MINWEGFKTSSKHPWRLVTVLRQNLFCKFKIMSKSKNPVDLCKHKGPETSQPWKPTHHRTLVFVHQPLFKTDSSFLQESISNFLVLPSHFSLSTVSQWSRSLISEVLTTSSRCFVRDLSVATNLPIDDSFTTSNRQSYPPVLCVASGGEYKASWTSRILSDEAVPVQVSAAGILWQQTFELYESGGCRCAFVCGNQRNPFAVCKGVVAAVFTVTTGLSLVLVWEFAQN